MAFSAVVVSILPPWGDFTLSPQPHRAVGESGGNQTQNTPAEGQKVRTDGAAMPHVSGSDSAHLAPDPLCGFCLSSLPAPPEYSLAIKSGTEVFGQEGAGHGGPSCWVMGESRKEREGGMVL